LFLARAASGNRRMLVTRVAEKYRAHFQEILVAVPPSPRNGRAIFAAELAAAGGGGGSGACCRGR